MWPTSSRSGRPCARQARPRMLNRLSTPPTAWQRISACLVRERGKSSAAGRRAWQAGSLWPHYGRCKRACLGKPSPPRGATHRMLSSATFFLCLSADLPWSVSSKARTPRKHDMRFAACAAELVSLLCSPPPNLPHATVATARGVSTRRRFVSMARLEQPTTQPMRCSRRRSRRRSRCESSRRRSRCR